MVFRNYFCSITTLSPSFFKQQKEVKPLKYYIMTKHIKVFSGSTLITNRLAHLLDEIQIPSLIKDFKESSRLAGFGITDNYAELLIYESDYSKAEPIIEKFKKEISK